MNKINVGNHIVYTSAAGTRKALVLDMHIGPTARPGFMTTWMTLEIPIQPGVKFGTRLQIPADDTSLKAFRVAVVD